MRASNYRVLEMLAEAETLGQLDEDKIFPGTFDPSEATRLQSLVLLARFDYKNLAHAGRLSQAMRDSAIGVALRAKWDVEVEYEKDTR